MTEHVERTYIGRRNTTDGKIAYAYLDEGGSEFWLRKPVRKGAHVGETFVLTFTDETHTSYWTGGERGPRVTGRADVDSEILLKWQALDVAAYQSKAQADAMNRVIRETSPLDTHIDALAKAAQSMTPTQRGAFARYVAERIR